MTQYECLEQLADQYNILINTQVMREDDPLDGLFVSLKDGGSMILINRHRTLAQRTAALAEELGHYFRSVGDLRDLSDIAAAKSELSGQAWSYDWLLPPPVLEAAIKNGEGASWAVAEEVNLPEDFVQEASRYHLRRCRPKEKSSPQAVQEIVRRREARLAWQTARESASKQPAQPAAPRKRQNSAPKEAAKEKPGISLGFGEDYRARAHELFGLAPDDRRWDAIIMAMLITGCRDRAQKKLVNTYSFYFPPVVVRGGRIYHTRLKYTPCPATQRRRLERFGYYGQAVNRTS
ncbi:MAG: hypothetical protein GX540_04430 [Clostridiales bacterium]|nr:hypothetical protein [Clostridiales bacterium]